VEPNTPVRVVATKWGGRPHWQYDALWLGTDTHGSWTGVPVGTVISRPGATVVTDQPQVVLFPADGYVATFYADQGQMPCQVYVDISTEPVWSEGRVTSIDLDLDVILGNTGRVWVDDEDEFADHKVRWGYPPSVVSSAIATCASVAADLTARHPPYDGAHLLWLEALSRRTLEP
jgi:uncharacterized protein